MLGAVGRTRVTGVRLLIASGLIGSAVLVAAVGGGWGVVIAAVQAALGGAMVLRPRSSGPLAGAVLALAPVPLAAARHWTARLPGACRCARLAHPPPGLLSVTGLVVALDVALLGLILWVIASTGHGKVGKSQP